MIKLLLTKFWPAFIPIGLYLLWLFLKKRKAKKNGDNVPTWRDGPWLYAVIASLLIVIVGFLILALMQETGEETSYTPKRFEGGVLMDESFK